MNRNLNPLPETLHRPMDTEAICLALLRAGTLRLVEPLLAFVPEEYLEPNRVFDDPDSFLVAAGTSGVGLVLFAAEDKDARAERSLRHFTRDPLLRIVILSRFSPVEVNLLAPLLARGRPTIVWSVDSKRRLRRAILEAHRIDPVQALAHFLQGIPDLSPFVLSVIRLVCTQEHPCRTVREVSAKLRVSESTLRYHWATSFDDASLKHLMDWSLLLRAVRLRKSFGWVRVSSLLGVHKRTLERIACRLTSMSLAETASKEDEVAGEFASWSRAAFPLFSSPHLPLDSGGLSAP